MHHCRHPNRRLYTYMVFEQMYIILKWGCFLTLYSHVHSHRFCCHHCLGHLVASKLLQFSITCQWLWTNQGLRQTKAQSEQLALCMAKQLDLCGSKSPVPTSKLVSSLQPKAGPSRTSQVFFRPPTPAPTSNSDNNMDNVNIVDPDPMITIPTPTPTPAPSLN
jgi:hypothetical protein